MNQVLYLQATRAGSDQHLGLRQKYALVCPIFALKNWVKQLQVFLTFLERKRAGIASGDEEPDDEEEGKGEDGNQVPGIHDAITNRLKREEQEESGKFKQSIAENFSKDNAPDLFQTR